MDIRQKIASRIKQARESYGLRQEDMAGALDITRQTYSRIERGEVAVDSDALVRIAVIVDRPLNYFYEDRAGDGFKIALRADDNELLDIGLQNRLLDKMIAYADLEAAAGISHSHGLPPTEPVRAFSPETKRIVKRVADDERGRLGLGQSAPIGDLVGLLEAIDIRVIPFKHDPGPQEARQLLSGFSAFSESLGATIFVNAHPSVSVEHQLFTLAHEYAHLVFHRSAYSTVDAGYKTRGKRALPEEKVANHFAGCFLMPESALLKFLPEKAELNPEDVFMVKRSLRVSYAALLMRLKDEALIEKRNLSWLWAVWKKRGWDQAEPFPVEEGLVFHRRCLGLARQAFQENRASLDFISEVLEKPRKEVAALARGWEEDLRLHAIS